ncbi:hypothetical protein BCIN_06g03330 [Botrytis cinerea B05.10]|uniref:Uncharacterized protein n=1 Tax=Botryotinia fuckeliana (strain B05.10) TaxID=332648 RepID=A0A384JJT5_BOTFB|nr:hypothetical protein BCIN_06g03330 [Botrytis cinerea B05.10]ATZ50859.1 hypothetical protein BCIN_06g03330 [Botrytis cinerea B05.10]
MMMEVKKEGSTMLGAEDEKQATAGVREENSENDWEARYSKVRFNQNMTCEELLESLKHLTGPGAEDEKKRRVIKWTQTEKGRRQAAEAQARNKEKKIEKIKKIQLRKESKIVRDAQRAGRREIADAKLRWDAEHPEEAAKRRDNSKGARKRAAKKAEKRLLAESQNARERGLSTATDENMAKSSAARGVGEEAVEADAMNETEEMADDDADVNLIKGLEYTENSTFSLAIRQR